MCGIAGFFGTPSAPREIALDAMLSAIRHRGPDDQGTYIDGQLAIGMRRLSIIDLSSGHQPIPNEDESVWIVFNGEIYNHRELRSELEGLGHRFRTHSDTEAILHLYEQFGPDCLKRLRGMFALAIWSLREQKLFLARDRFGKKPLYYTQTPQGFYFGSEIKSLRAAGVPLRANREALLPYFQFGYIPDPLSAFQDVQKLPAGSWLELTAFTGGIRRGTYWTFPAPAVDEAPGFDGQAELGELRRVFDESVRCRLLADVPLGAFLSGGIDSALVVASMAAQSKEPVKTFSIGFAEASMNELPWAKLVAERYGADHHEIIVKPDSTQLARRIAWQFDEPFGDASAVPTGIVSEFAAAHVKVALSGDGGDELFGGYPRLWETRRLDAFARIPKFLRRGIDWLSCALPYASYGKNYLHMMSRSTPLEMYFERNFAPYFLREKLLSPGYMLPAEGGYLLRLFGSQLSSAPADTLSQAQYWEATANLTGDMLVKVDRMSMAHSLEVRCPLLDQELAVRASRFPHSWRLRNGRGKYNLIESMKDRLPEALLTRPKSGFGIPLAQWFRGELRPMLLDTLLSRTFLNRDIVNPAFLRSMIEEHDSGRRDNSGWLWWLLMLELWFQEYPSAA